MSENETQNQTEPSADTKPLGLSRPGRLELKKTVESGEVRQSFSHGRSKAVQVEKKKKRTFQRATTGGMTEVKDRPEMALVTPEPEPAAEIDTMVPAREAPTRTLTEQERAARARALEGARDAERESRAAADLEAKRQAEIEAEAARAAAEQTGREAAEREAQRKIEGEAAAKAEDQKKSAAAPGAKSSDDAGGGAARPKATARKRPDAESGGPEADTARAKRKGDSRRLSIGRRGEQSRRRGGKMTVVQALSDDERQRSLASMRRAREREKRAAKTTTGGAEAGKVVREVVIPEAITVQELANRMAVRGADVIKTLMKMGAMATINQLIDTDTSELVVNEFGHKVKRVREADVEIGLTGTEDDTASLVARAPVVTVMGHVDHGKTSLLDALRETDVVSGEAGGITQHIGAYQVEMSSGAQITFLDTPGHEAFTQMRLRGAKATDIVVLVVAADDGVMPQTAEAIQHAQAASVPMIVAINKMDRPDANPDRVRNDLLQHNVVLEGVGGDVLSVEVSATEKTNLDKLEETILLQAELLELKANPDRPAEGVVVESRRERGRGVVTTILVQRGTLGIGDIFVAGSEWGRVRAVVDDKGRNVSAAGPSQPVEVLGLSDTPQAGDNMVVVEDEGRAREVTEYRRKVARDQRAVTSSRGTVEQMLSQIAEGEAAELPIVVKADVHGSLEAILASLDKFATDEVLTRVLLSGVGGINESDISLAAASNALVIGFNVRADGQGRALARRDGVEIRYYSVIYELLDDLRAMLSGMLAPTLREDIIGYARIKQVFNITKVGKIAGCEVTEGTVRRGARIRLLRDNVVIYQGALTTLKRHQDEVREVKEGLECGMALENYQDIKENDVLEAYEIEEIARTIGED